MHKVIWWKRELEYCRFSSLQYDLAILLATELQCVHVSPLCQHVDRNRHVLVCGTQQKQCPHDLTAKLRRTISQSYNSTAHTAWLKLKHNMNNHPTTARNHARDTATSKRTCLECEWIFCTSFNRKLLRKEFYFHLSRGTMRIYSQPRVAKCWCSSTNLCRNHGDGLQHLWHRLGDNKTTARFA